MTHGPLVSSEVMSQVIMPGAVPVRPLEAWLGVKTGLRGRISPATLQEWQFARLTEKLEFVKSRGKHYAESLKRIVPSEIQGPEDLQRLPFTGPEDLRRDSASFVCLPQKDVARIMTLNTSGTSGRPKRLYFSEKDQESCVDFFAGGMRTMVGPGDTARIFLGKSTPGNTVDLLRRGLERIGVKAMICDTSGDAARVLSAPEKEACECLIGMPARIFQMAKANPGLRPKSVLLCADYVPKAVVEAVRELWRCEIFTHYGSTESGLGGAVSCAARDGLHIWASELLFEIVDPKTGLAVPDGEYGEVVFTTLAREAMPLIRYRTGDISRILSDRCACGSALRRLDDIQGRYENLIALPGGGGFSIHQLDEIVFKLPEVLDYVAEFQEGSRLDMTVRLCVPQSPENLARRIADALALDLKVTVRITRAPLPSRFVKRMLMNTS